MSRRDVVQVRCSEVEKERWREKAASQGLELSAWIRLVLDRAARGQALPEVRSLFPDKN